jgi:hypothetical protein
MPLRSWDIHTPQLRRALSALPTFLPARSLPILLEIMGSGTVDHERRSALKCSVCRRGT